MQSDLQDSSLTNTKSTVHTDFRQPQLKHLSGKKRSTLKLAAGKSSNRSNYQLELSINSCVADIKAYFKPNPLWHFSTSSCHFFTGCSHMRIPKAGPLTPTIHCEWGLALHPAPFCRMCLCQVTGTYKEEQHVETINSHCWALYFFIYLLGTPLAYTIVAANLPGVQTACVGAAEMHITKLSSVCTKLHALLYTPWDIQNDETPQLILLL